MDFNQFNALSRMAQMGARPAQGSTPNSLNFPNQGNQQQAGQSFQQLGQFLGQGLNQAIPVEDQMAIQESLVGMAQSPMGQMAQDYIKKMIMQSGMDGMRDPGMQNRPTVGMPGLPGPSDLNDSQIRDFIMKGIMRGG